MFEDWLPHYLSIGVGKNEFFHSTPKILNAYDKAFERKIVYRDAEFWRNGQYTFSAVYVAVEHCLGGKKAKSEYIKEPLLKDLSERIEYTQEELDNRELQKMILAEEQWIKNDKRRGLPETLIK